MTRSQGSFMGVGMLKGAARRIVSTPYGNALLRFLETFAFGGVWAERLLVWIMQRHYKSRFRREWLWTEHAPHFFNHRFGGFDFVYGESPTPYPYFRGFFVAELLHTGDRLLDIGCGDGFFTKRFFSSRCAAIDAVDIEPSAIETARRFNAAPNISYAMMDAVRSPFPSPTYDVVVWDGAIGHFSKESVGMIVQKIKDALNDRGIFVGSESLGREGHDHLQFFESPKDVDRLFADYFRYRVYRVVTYKTPFNSEMVRREVFWRCTDDPSWLDQTIWKSA